MKFLGMGGFELVIILIVILLIFGPKNLPKLGNALGKTVSNLRSGMNEGKKKKGEEAEASEADETSADEATASEPAALEGEVESVEPVAEAENATGAAVGDAANDAAADVAVEETSSEEETVSATEPGATEGGNAPKKVRRVVKKKVE